MRGGSSSSGSDSRRGLMRDDALGITFEHCGADEAEFLYEEIVTRRAYLQASGEATFASDAPRRFGACA